MNNELEAIRTEGRNLLTELSKTKTTNDEMRETVETLRRENNSLADEIKELTGQLDDGGRSQHEMQKAVYRLEVEKNELQRSLDKAESL